MLTKNHSFINKIKSITHKHSMISHGDSICIAVSGGADSISLLYGLHALQQELGFTITIMHLNHMIRGKEAKSDADFVRQEAKKLGVECITKEVNIKQFAKKNSLSTQEAGREIRYSFFTEESSKKHSPKIALAHTLDDQAETILMRLFRGSGTKGISGIPAVRDSIIRPLIETSREEVEFFLNSNDIKWVEDKSNFSTDYLRNKIRLELLPMLKKEYNPNIVTTLDKFRSIVAAEEDFLSDYSEKILTNCISKKTNGNLTIDTTLLQKQPIAIKRRMLRGAINRLKGNTRKISFDHIESIIKIVETGVSEKRYKLPDNTNICYYNKKLILSKNEHKTDSVAKFDKKIIIPGETAISEISMKLETTICHVKQINYKNSDDKNTAFLDLKKTGVNIKIRQRCNGDHFSPLGMKGEKKLKDFLINEKVPKDKRNSIPLIVSEDGTIIWVAGMRIAEKAKIDINTEQVIKLRISLSNK